MGVTGWDLVSTLRARNALTVAQALAAAAAPSQASEVGGARTCSTQRHSRKHTQGVSTARTRPMQLCAALASILLTSTRGNAARTVLLVRRSCLCSHTPQRMMPPSGCTSPYTCRRARLSLSLFLPPTSRVCVCVDACFMIDRGGRGGAGAAGSHAGQRRWGRAARRHRLRHQRRRWHRRWRCERRGCNAPDPAGVRLGRGRRSGGRLLAGPLGGAPLARQPQPLRLRGPRPRPALLPQGPCAPGLPSACAQRAASVVPASVTSGGRGKRWVSFPKVPQRVRRCAGANSLLG